MKTRLVLAIIIALGLLSGLAQGVSAQDNAVTVEGQVTNGTQDGTLPEGLPVTLHVYSEGALSGTYPGETDVEGVFSFDLVDLGEGDQLVAATSYLNISYTSSSFSYQPGQEIPQLSIVVYETTEESNHIVVSQMTMMLNTSDGELRIGEYYLLSNFGDRTWMGTFDSNLGLNATVQIKLPSEAESLWFSGGDLGDRFQLLPEGVTDTAPIAPGAPSAEVFLTYAIPYDGEIDFSKSLNLPVESVGFLIAEGSGVTVEGDGIEFNASGDADNEFTISYLAPGFGPTEAFNFTVRDQKQSTISMNWNLGLGVLSLVAAGLGIFGLLQGNRKVALPESADSLLRKISILDDSLAAGTIQKEQYSKQREALIEEIRAFIKRK